MSDDAPLDGLDDARQEPAKVGIVLLLHALGVRALPGTELDPPRLTLHVVEEPAGAQCAHAFVRTPERHKTRPLQSPRAFRKHPAAESCSARARQAVPDAPILR
eukprot:6204768-Pleurochrysis_carterae.AAC.2